MAFVCDSLYGIGKHELRNRRCPAAKSLKFVIWQMQLDSLAQTLLSATVPTAIWRFAIPTRNRVAPATLFSALPVCRCIDIGSPQQRITDKPANAEVQIGRA